ncbi:hypothetical protein ACLOJK_001647 [Asimina triloba]
MDRGENHPNQSCNEILRAFDLTRSISCKQCDVWCRENSAASKVGENREPRGNRQPHCHASRLLLLACILGFLAVGFVARTFVSNMEKSEASSATELDPTAYDLLVTCPSGLPPPQDAPCVIGWYASAESIMQIPQVFCRLCCLMISLLSRTNSGRRAAVVGRRVVRLTELNDSVS